MKKHKATAALSARLYKHRRYTVLVGMPLCIAIGAALADLLNRVMESPLLATGLSFYLVCCIALMWSSNERVAMTLQAMSKLESENHRLLKRNLRAELQAHYDGLTRLPNIRLLPDRFAQAAERARRNKTHVAFYLLTLEDFEPITARYGARAGSVVISVTAQRLQRALRETDTIVRVSNSDFVVMAEAMKENAHVRGLCGKLEQALDRPVELDDVTLIRPHTRMAYASYPADGTDLDTLFCKVRRHLDVVSPYVVAANRKAISV